MTPKSSIISRVTLRTSSKSIPFNVTSLISKHHKPIRIASKLEHVILQDWPCHEFTTKVETKILSKHFTRKHKPITAARGAETLSVVIQHAWFP